MRNGFFRDVMQELLQIIAIFSVFYRMFSIRPRPYYTCIL